MSLRRQLDMRKRTRERTCFVISSCSSRGNVEKVSNLVPIRNGIAVCAGQSDVKLVVSARERHNQTNNATTHPQGERGEGIVKNEQRKKNCTLLNPRACLYHSLTELSVDLRERSNMNKIATASLHTRGNILTNSRWPPRSQSENVIDVRRTVMVFSMKFTPAYPIHIRIPSLRWRK